MFDHDDELDVEPEDARPEQDFATDTFNIHAHNMDGNKLAVALARVGSNDPNVRELVTIIESLRQAFGDKDELLSRYAEDLEAGLSLILLEMKAHPAIWAARQINEIADLTERARKVEEFECMGRELKGRLMGAMITVGLQEGQAQRG